MKSISLVEMIIKLRVAKHNGCFRKQKGTKMENEKSSPALSDNEARSQFAGARNDLLSRSNVNKCQTLCLPR